MTRSSECSDSVLDEGKVLMARRFLSLPASSAASTAVVHFQITSLQLPRLATISAETSDEALQDQLEAGELGCLVDPHVTKLVQAGIEHSLVPDSAGFLGIGKRVGPLEPFNRLPFCQPIKRPSILVPRHSATPQLLRVFLNMCKLA